MATAVKSKQAKRDPLTILLDAFYAQHAASYDVNDGYTNGKPIIRRMTAQEVISTWPPRSWWLAVEALIDGLISNYEALPVWKLDRTNWLIHGMLKFAGEGRPGSKFDASEIGTRIDLLKAAEDNTRHVKHEDVFQLWEDFHDRPNCEESLQLCRGCSREQALKILGLRDKHGQRNAAIDADELEAELTASACWPQDRQAKEAEEKHRAAFEKLKQLWARRPRIAAHKAEEAASSLDAIMT